MNMKHLTVDEITSFVSLNKMDSASVKFACEVNSHLRLCPECCKKVNAFVAVQDALNRSQLKNTGSAYGEAQSRQKHVAGVTAEISDD